MQYPIYSEDTGTYLVELYDNASLVADVKYYQVRDWVDLPVDRHDGVLLIDNVEFIYVINHIVERYEDDNGDELRLVHKYCFEDPLEEYGITMDNVDDIVEQLIVTEEL